MSAASSNKPFGRGFTLIELLVVIAIIVLLVAILAPMLSRAKTLAKDVKCRATVSTILKGLYIYAAANNDDLACGSMNPLRYAGQAPQAPVATLASFQFWLGINQEPAALGVPLDGKYIPEECLFCPDDPAADSQLEMDRYRTWSSENAWSSYLYRQLDGQQPSATLKTKIDDLGLNAQGARVKALVMDMHSTMVWTGLPLKSNHGGTRTTLGLADCSVLVVPDDGSLTLNGSTDAVFTRLDAILEYADSLSR